MAFAGLPPPSLPFRRTLRLHISTLYGFRWTSAASYLKAVGSTSYIFHTLAPQFKSVVLVVRSEEERREVEAAIQDVEEKYRPLFEVELVD